MKNKILFAIGDLRIGGVARVQSVIVNELSRRNHDIDLFSFRETESYYPLFKKVIFPEKSLNNWRFQKLLIQTGINKYILRRTVDMITRPNDKHFENLVKYVRENKYSTIVLVEQWIIYAEKLKQMFPEMKLIGWLHLDLNHYETYHLAKSKNQFLDGLRGCDRLIVLTQEEKNVLENRGFEKVQVLHNPLTLNDTNKVVDLNKKIISWVGRIDNLHKGLDYLIEIAKSLPDDWKIRVAGSGRDNKKFKKLIEKNRLTNKILWVGPKNGEELTNHYLNSSIFLMTSRFESFGLVLVEAMNYGLPIIAFSQTGSDEILKNEQYGLVAENGNIKEISDKLMQLISDKNQREFWSKKSKERSKDFSLEKIAIEWEHILGTESGNE